MRHKDKPPHVGKDAVVIGDPGGSVGEGAVVIRPSTPDGNIHISGTVAAGRDSIAGQNSIAIGAGAVAGVVDLSALADLRTVLATGRPDIAQALDDLEIELKKPQKDQSRIRALWATIEGAATVAGAIDLLSKVKEFVSL